MAEHSIETATSDVHLHWRVHTSSSPVQDQDKQYPLRFLEVVATGIGETPNIDNIDSYRRVALSATTENQRSSSQAASYLLQQLDTAERDPTFVRSFAFILPHASGYMIRSDFLNIRLQSLKDTYDLVSFSEPLQYFDCTKSTRGEDDMWTILRSAIGVVSPQDLKHSDKNFSDIESKLAMGLTFPWLSVHKPTPRRVALVRGRPNYRVGGPVYRAAKALGVALIIIDEDNHWLQADSTPNKDLREAFLTIDMTEDDGLPKRIAAAVKAYSLPVHGIFTLSDNYLVSVAKAAELLKLPTSPASAYDIAFDKGLTRQLHAAPNEYATARDIDEIVSLLAKGTFQPEYPLIVKPRTRGWNSQYVQKVHDQEEMLRAVRNICPHYKDGVVIEAYFDGPEIDVNIVMEGGKVVFQEIVDEPPSLGDLTTSAIGSNANFLENGMRAPSLLPQEEQRSIFESVGQTLKKAGFTNGVFHVEARISGSSMTFQEHDGSIDLVSTSTTPNAEVRAHIIEINARPPGLRAQLLTQMTYGIDYFAVRILSAIDDTERLRSLCHPFSSTLYPQGAQAWHQVVHLSVLSKGAAAGIDTIEKLISQVPNAVAHTVEYQCCFERGEKMPDPADYADVYGHVIVRSRESRKEVVKAADEILAAYYSNGADATLLGAQKYIPVEHETLKVSSELVANNITEGQRTRLIATLGK